MTCVGGWVGVCVCVFGGADNITIHSVFSGKISLL
jgi:hypothetical protein